MKKITFINSLGSEIIIHKQPETNYTPLILKSFEENTNVNIYNIKGASQDGLIYTGNTLDAKDISIELYVVANDDIEMAKITDNIIRTMNPKLGEGYLIYDNDITTKKIKCLVNHIPKFTLLPGYFNGNGKVSSSTISLISNDPFWIDGSENKEEIALWKGDFHFPLIIPANSGIIMGYREPSLIVNVNNKGQVKTGMIIEFYARGSLKNPSLFNINTREFIKINKDMINGEKIIINTNYNNKKIIQNLNGNEVDILNYLDIVGGGDTFLQLDIGDNLFRYNADQNLDNLEVSIYHNNSYLGV